MKVLLIEDDNQLRKLEIMLLKNLGHEVVPCQTAEEGLDKFQSEAFSFIMLDMVLPGMSGLEFSRKIRDLPQGDEPYILAITSWDEEQLPSILQAGANDYIQKPIDVNLFNIRIHIAEQSISNIRERVRMRRQMRDMVTSDIMQSTLQGFIRVITNVLSLMAPAVFGRSVRVARIARELAEQVNLQDSWELAAAAMLSQLGCVSIPQEIMTKALDESTLNVDEQTMFLSHAEHGANLLEGVPRMEKIARIIAYQEKLFDGGGYPKDDVKGDDIPVESRILKIALDLDRLYSRDVPRSDAFLELSSRTGWYDPALLKIFSETPQKEKGDIKRVWINQLEDGMIFMENVLSKTDALLVMKGHAVTPSVREQLNNFSKNFHIQQPIEVEVASS